MSEFFIAIICFWAGYNLATTAAICKQFEDEEAKNHD